MFRYLLATLLCLPGFLATAQTSPLVAFKGMVLDAGDSMGAAFVNIWGLQSQLGGTTKVDGSFNIYVMPGDTLRLSSVGYLTKVWIVPENVSQLPPPTIMLYREVYNIDEVVITPGAMLRQPQTTPPPPPAPVNNQPTFGVGNGGITFGFDTKAAHLRKQQEQINAWEYEAAMQDFIAYRYSPEFIQQFIPLSDTEVDAFKSYCRLPDQFVVESNDYDLAKAIKDCYKTFKRQ